MMGWMMRRVFAVRRVGTRRTGEDARAPGRAVVRVPGRVALGLVVMAGGMVSAWGQEVSPKVDSAVVKGLEYLAQQQQPDGAFEKGGPKLAISGLSLLAFMASGHVPGDGRYGQVVRRGLDYVLDQFPKDGYVGKVDGSRMYGQGIVTLALAEAYGVEPDAGRRARIWSALTASVQVIQGAQNVQKDDNHAGGWRYEPTSVDSDLSLSGWNALSLRACNNIGIAVPKECIDRATKYVTRCYRREENGFGYQPWNPSSPAMTGVGVLSLSLMDRMDSPEVKAAGNYLGTVVVSDDTRFSYYSFYYVTHAAFQLGDPIWGRVWKMSSEHLTARQQEDGGWPASQSGEEPGRVYATSMAVLTLSTPNGLLPVHQK